MFKKKTYTLPLARTYVANWGIKEAVRELIQNCIDSSGKSEMLFVKAPDGSLSLSLRNSNTRLEPSSLVLGITDKAGDSSKIGQFGEGYKLALLVLARNNLEVVIHNGDQLWKPGFAHSKLFDCELLVIESEDLGNNAKDLVFTIYGLSEEDAIAIENSYLGFNESTEYQSTSYGRILFDKGSKLYVNGLFVCNIDDYKYGYDLKPDSIELERDRNTVDNWSLSKVTTKMWLENKDYDKLAEMIDADVQDVAHAYYNSPELVKEACYSLFQKNYPGGIPASSKAELDELVNKGFSKVVVVNSNMYCTTRSAPSYKSLAQSHEVSKTPLAMLEEFLESNKSYMRRLGQVNFKKLLETAKSQKWSN